MSHEMIGIMPLAKVLDVARHKVALDRIFFSSSARQSFASDEERSVFRERWLGRFLGHEARHGFVVIAHGLGEPGAERSGGQLIGYLVASLDNPARNPRFADIGYFQSFAALCEWYPAQLHINIDASYRSFGIGARLIEQFCDYARARGTAGVHVVTSPASRNVSFYNRLGFEDVGRNGVGANEVVFLGRTL